VTAASRSPADARKPPRVTDLPDSAGQDQASDAAWLERAAAFEDDPANAIKVIATPRKWHPELRHLRESTLKPSKRDEEDVIHNWAYAPPPYSGVRGVPLRTSKTTAARALAFVNAVFLAAEARGFSATVDLKQARFALGAGAFSVHFAVREKFDKRLEPFIPGSDFMRSIEVGTGRLFVAAFRPLHYDAKILNEASFRPLEALASPLFSFAYEALVQWRESEREELRNQERQAERRKAWEREEQQRQADKAAKAEAERVAALEREKVVALQSEAAAWREAQEIRKYVAALGDAGTNAGKEWLCWALSIAETLDPLERRRKLLDKD
jgi:hypothetical protein